MIENKEKLRKADIFTGIVIVVFGLWIISQGLRMPLTDSWAGAQDVWYVAPAVFPLFVGAVLTLLGITLTVIALRAVGIAVVFDVLRWLLSAELVIFLKKPATIRFFAIIILFSTLVYLFIPRVDFFVCTILYLIVFISMFYFDDDMLLKKMLGFYLSGSVAFIILFLMKIPESIDKFCSYSEDLFGLIFIIAYCVYTKLLIGDKQELQKKFWIALIIAIVVPLTVGSIFKYLLMVPMPREGLIGSVMDALRYWDF